MGPVTSSSSINSTSQVNAPPTIDIVVVVQGASATTQRCLASVLHHRSRGARVIIVNDGGGVACSAWLRQVSELETDVTILERELSIGYTRALNAGLKLCTTDYIVVLRENVSVAAGWLEGLVRCAGSSRAIGIVAPLSNTAAPEAAFADEGAARGSRPLVQMAALVTEASQRVYPRTHVVDGACLLVSAALLGELGQFDEATFPLGVGVVHDFCLRANNAAYEVAIADDVYVFSEELPADSEGEGAVLAKAARQSLERKHRQGVASSVGSAVADTAPVRTAKQAITPLSMPGLPETAGDAPRLRILFLLPSKGGTGGNHAVVQDALAMTRLGAVCRIASLSGDLADVRKDYRDAPHLEKLLLHVEASRLLDVAREYEVVVATHHSCVESLARVHRAFPEIVPVYDVEDYEPLHFELGSLSWKRAFDSYCRVPAAVLFARSRWVIDQVSEQHGVSLSKVPLGIDHGLYFPGSGRAESVVKVVAMVRPQSPRRGAARTMRVLSETARRFPNAEFHVFGCNPDRPAFQELVRDFSFTCHGMLLRSEMGALLRNCDVFLDLSDYHAVGRLGLEAMASGCVAIVPRAGGAVEYAKDGENALVVDSNDELGCVRRLASLLENPAEIRRLRLAALAAARRYDANDAALSLLQLLTQGVAARKLELSRAPQLAEPASKLFAAGGDYVALFRAFQNPQVQRSVEKLRLERWPSAERRLAKLRRKSRKLARDPDAFFADSQSSVVRGLGTLLKRRSRSLPPR
jgi:glycosyltransferase involved in cell wall biosynthesis